tara:strand:- start:47 stop:412 length:366 start_codon:yes stop_codon:yes gene_type:complete
MESKHTKGECKHAHREFGIEGMYATEVFVGDTVICQMDWAGEEFNENGKKGLVSRRKYNAQLIADAFNVTNETNMTPRELQKSHAELLEALEQLLNVDEIDVHSVFKAQLQANQAIKNATK